MPCTYRPTFDFINVRTPSCANPTGAFTLRLKEFEGQPPTTYTIKYRTSVTDGSKDSNGKLVYGPWSSYTTLTVNLQIL